MTRKPREIVAGGIYHVYARGNDRRSVFADDADRHAYLMMLTEECSKREWVQLAFCLMTNHFHLLLETPKPNLSEGMHRIQTRYVQRFNRRHKRSGHLFQGRFGANRIDSDEQFVATTRYIGMNPVEAGLCDAPNDWKWMDCSLARRRCEEMFGGQVSSVVPDPKRGA